MGAKYGRNSILRKAFWSVRCPAAAPLAAAGAAEAQPEAAAALQPRGSDSGRDPAWLQPEHRLRGVTSIHHAFNLIKMMGEMT